MFTQTPSDATTFHTANVQSAFSPSTPPTRSAAPTSSCIVAAEEQRGSESTLHWTHTSVTSAESPHCLVPNNGMCIPRTFASVSAWDAALSSPSVLSGSSLFRVASKCIQAVEASMPMLEAETQKSSSLSASSQQSQSLEPQQPADSAPSPQADHTVAEATLASPSSAVQSYPTAMSESHPLPAPASLSPAPFEPPAPIILTPTSAFLSLPPPHTTAPQLHSEPETSVLPPIVTAHSSSSAEQPPPLQNEEVLPEAQSDAEASVTDHTILSRKPKRSLADTNISLMVDEQRGDGMPAVTQSDLPAAPKPLPASPSTSTATATASAAGDTEAATAETCFSATEAPTDQTVLHEMEPTLASLATVATEEESEMLLRIGRGMALLDASAALTREAQSLAHDGHSSTATADLNVTSTSQDDEIEDVDDHETGKTATAQRRSAKPISRLNKRRIGAATEQRSMPRPNPQHIPLCPPPPIPPPAATPLSDGDCSVGAAVAPSQPPLLKPKPKRSVLQSLSQLHPTLTRSDSSSTASSACDRTLLTPLSLPLQLPPPPRLLSTLFDGGISKRRQLEASSFYAIHHTDEAGQADEQEEENEQRKQQCMTVRCEEQADEIRRLKARNMQLAADNRQLKSKVARLTDELRQANQQLNQQCDGERTQQTERMIKMTPLELEALIDSRLSRQLRHLPGRRDAMEDD